MLMRTRAYMRLGVVEIAPADGVDLDQRPEAANVVLGVGQQRPSRGEFGLGSGDFFEQLRLIDGLAQETAFDE